MSHLPRPTAFPFAKKVYAVGETYSYADLPRAVQKDLRLQEDDVSAHYGRSIRDVFYFLTLIPHEEAEHLLRERFGDEGYERLARSAQVAALAEEIERKGLKTPPVLDEGLDRAAALVLLGLDVPYFMIAEPIGDRDFINIPTLDGPWPR
jgi:hypothetical protein